MRACIWQLVLVSGIIFLLSCRAQQKFRERQREKSRQTASQVDKLQTKIAELKQQLAAVTLQRQLSSPPADKLQVSWGGTSLEPFQPYHGWSRLPDQLMAMQLYSGKRFTRKEVIEMTLVQYMDTRQVGGLQAAYAW